jgi:16S rRNA (cytosine1402-N4)-methyltransferase
MDARRRFEPREPTPSPPGKPARRKRYRGTHPRSFEEKYKELAPERYPGEAAKVRARGQTPAGTHVPVMLAEVLEVLRPGPGLVYVDCTLGHGGHAEGVAPRLLPGGRAYGLDLDGDEIDLAARRLAALGIEIRARRLNFAGIGKLLREEGLDGIDLLLADLGASSLQIDDPGRGFSFKVDGPLDMRMDRSRGPTALEWLLAVGEEELAGVLAEWGEEPDASGIAAAIKGWLARSSSSGVAAPSTAGLVRTILHAKGLGPRHAKASALDLHPAARTFQAIRMAVNREVESLSGLLRDLPYVLKPSGRAAVITFHPGEERLVAAAFAEGRERGTYAAGSTEPARPSGDEIRSNPRARSARLHWVERAAEKPSEGGHFR